MKNDVKIKSVDPGVMSDALAMYVPKIRTIYYDSLLDKHPNLKKQVIEHELEHSMKITDSSSKEWMINLKMEIRDQVKIFGNRSGLRNSIKMNKLKYELMKEQYNLTRKTYGPALVYSIVYVLFVMFNSGLLFPVFVYHSVKMKSLGAYLTQQGLMYMVFWIIIVTQLARFMEWAI